MNAIKSGMSSEQYARTQEQANAQKAFSLVCPTRRDARDWREPIDQVVTQSELKEAGVTIEQVAASVAFMTATEATAEILYGTGPTICYRVTAKGYSRGPAGDH